MKLFSKKTPVVQLTGTKPQSKLIVFAGTENCLPAYFTAVKLHEQADVLLIDNSQTHDLIEAVPKSGEFGNANEISVAANKMITPEVFEKFDYVVAYLGYNYDEEYCQAADLIVLVSDYTLVSKKFMSDFDPKDTPVRMLFINRITNRVSEKLLLDSMKHYQVSDGDSVLSCEFTEEDAAAYISFLYEGYRNFSSMSREYQKSISVIVKDAVNGYQIAAQEEETL